MRYSKFTRIFSAALSALLIVAAFCSCSEAKVNVANVVEGGQTTTETTGTTTDTTEKTETTEKFVLEKMKAEQSLGYGFDFLGGKDVMPIVGYHGAMNQLMSYKGEYVAPSINDNFMKIVQESGVNVISNNGGDYNSNPRLTYKLLDLGQKYGVGITVIDNAISHQVNKNLPSFKEIDERISNYINHPACVGMYVIDEPLPPMIETGTSDDLRITRNYTKAFQYLYKLDVFAFGNLFPMLGAGQRQRYEEEYLKEFTETCPTKALLYDKYPFGTTNDLDSAHQYLMNMAAIKKYADMNNIPWWPFIQSGAQWNDGGSKFDSDGYWPDEGSHHWIGSTSLAFGAQGIQYFPLEQPKHFAYALTEKYDFQRNGIIGAWGNKTRFFYYAQTMNKHIAAIDHVLMNSVHKGILTDDSIAEYFEDNEYRLEGKAWRELKDFSGKAMIGLFNYQGKSAFYVANFDNIYMQDMVLDLQDTYKCSVTIGDQTKYYQTKQVKFTLNPGCGALVVMQ